MRRHRFWISLGLLIAGVASAGVVFNVWRTLSARQPWAHVPGPCVDGAVLTVSGEGCGGGGTTFDRDQIYAPSLIKDLATEAMPCGPWPVGSVCYRMWYVGTIGEVRRIGYAVSADGQNWQRIPGPLPGGSVLGPGAAGAFDAGGVTMPSVLKEAGGFRMWYAGLDGAYHPNGIGVARSSDGVNWQRETTAPVLPKSGREGVFDRDELPALTVLKDRATAEAPCAAVPVGEACYRIWFEGLRTSPDYRFGIGHAVSADGVRWTRIAGASPDEAVLTYGWPRTYDARSVGVPFVLKDGALYRMWYEAWGSNGLFSVGYAASTNGVEWVRPAPLAAAFNGADDPGQHTPDDIWATRVLKEGPSYRLWYSISSRPNSRRIALAEMTPGEPLKAVALRRDGSIFILSFENAQAVPAGGSLLMTLPAGWVAQPEGSSGFGSEARLVWEPGAVTDAEAQGVARGALLVRLNSAVAPGMKEVRFSITRSSTALSTPAVLVLQSFSANEVLEYGLVAVP